MNRRILFRGKSIDDKSIWVYGDLVQYPDGSMLIDTTHSDFAAEGAAGQGVFRVDPDSVGQFIGLYDENGIEIFEGDICEGDYIFWVPDPNRPANLVYRYQIWFDESGFYGFDKDGDGWPVYNIDHIKVVGNWYDDEREADSD